MTILFILILKAEEELRKGVTKTPKQAVTWVAITL